MYAEATAPTASASGDHPRLIIRIDDLGFCHASNLALERVLEEGVCTAVSVIVNTPWIDEAADILRAHPEVSVGVHLTLNSEWRHFRWGPVLPVSEVPSLVDAFGKFYGSRRELMAHQPHLEEVTRELRAQVELARRKGLLISYVDYHMGAAVGCLEFQEAVERIALEYNIGISRYFGETYAPNVYFEPPATKIAKGLELFRGFDQPELYLFVCHPAEHTPELAAMKDMNAFGLENMPAHRQAVTDLLCSPELKRIIQENKIELVTYEALKAEGLHRMKRPFKAEPYADVVAKAKVPAAEPR
jgi:predicted glycoside hydrolase/deacetylase ChbG (UPF0249 family)